jgi:hypothetical protein
MWLSQRRLLPNWTTLAFVTQSMSFAFPVTVIENYMATFKEQFCWF